MHGYKPEYLAKEAARLINDPVLKDAVEAIKKAALEQLATVDPDDKTAVLRHQQQYAVASEFFTVLERAILALPTEEENGPV